MISRDSASSLATVPATELQELRAQLAATAEQTDKLAALLELARQRAEKAEKRAGFLERENAQLLHRLEKFLKQLYGRRSEQIDRNQLLLFLTAPDQTADANQQADAAAAPSTPQKPEAKKKAGHGRDNFPEHLPRERIEIEPSEQDRICPCCGETMVRIGEDVSEKGHYVPGCFIVKQYVRGKWACKKSHGTVVTAAPPPAVVDKSRFEPSVYAHVVTGKYGDHLPLHRQVGILARMGFEIAKSTLCDMVRDVALLVTAVLVEMKRQLRLEHYLRTDDTPVDVLPEKGSDRGVTQGRLWVYLTEDGKAVFDFTMSRCRDGPASFLEGFKGYLQGDGYAGYEHICRSGEVVKVGCWAHARRKFVEALDADRTRSAEAIRLIGRLYWIESAARKRIEAGKDFGHDALRDLRQRRSRKVLGQIKTWLDTQDRDPSLLPKSAVREAVGYALNQWPDLVRYTEDGRLHIDNNGSERALRQVAVGRKNFLFLGSSKGGDSAAALYSLIGSCKVMGLNPFAYMTDVLTQLATNPNTPPESLTPWAWRDARAKAAASAAMAPDAVPPAPK